MTYIHGDTIKTGKVQSADGKNYIDLQHNHMRFGDSSNHISWDGSKLGVTKAAIDQATIDNGTIGNWIQHNYSFTSEKQYSGKPVVYWMGKRAK